MITRRGQEGIGIVMSYANIALNFIVGMLYTPYMIKSLGQSEYGLYLQIGALVGYMSIADFGLHSTITRYVAKYRAENNEAEQKKFLGNCFWFYIAVTVILLIIGVFFVVNISWFLNAGISVELRKSAGIMAAFLLVSIVLSLPLGMFCSILEGYGEFLITNGVRFIGVILKTATLLLVLKCGYGAVGIVAVDTCFVLLIPAVYAFILYWKFNTKIQLVRFDLSKLREILRYSGYIFVLAIVNQFYWKIGQVVLGKLISPDASAIYGLAVQIINYITPITLTISGVFLPRITALIVTGKGEMSKVDDLLNKVGKYQALLISLILIGFVALGQPFIELWVGAEFEKTYYVVCILLCAIVPQTILTVGTSTLKALGKHKYQAIVYGASAVANVIIGTILAGNFGEIGMAVGTFISIALIQTPLMLWVFEKKAGLKALGYLLNLFKQLFIPTAIASLAIILIGKVWIVSGWLTFFSAIVFSCAVYGVIVYCWCLNKSEKENIRSWLKRKQKSTGG